MLTLATTQASPAGFDALISALAASPIAAVCVVLVWLFMNHIKQQNEIQGRREEGRDQRRQQHEERLAQQYASIAEQQRECIRENTLALREYVKGQS